MGFSVLKQHDFLRLTTQYTLIGSDGVAGHGMQRILSLAALAEQVSKLTDASSALCHAHQP